MERHTIQFEWVKGHVGTKYNELCDQLAKKEAMKYKWQVEKVAEGSEVAEVSHRSYKSDSLTDRLEKVLRFVECASARQSQLSAGWTHEPYISANCLQPTANNFVEVASGQ